MKISVRTAEAGMIRMMEALKPGMTFKEYAEKSWEIPDEFFLNRYFMVAYGVGLSGECPYIICPQDLDEKILK
ncbi:hypothetical protein DHX103_11150 [Planococcus sp. X10-3]|uniref:hypothetical protein n=1 Tax=Planococcus sp. X10-3 TaxID=3061240 RepID=UPI003BAEF025